MNPMKSRRASFLLLLCVVFFTTTGQPLQWAPDGKSYYRTEGDEIVQYTLPDQKRTVLVSKQHLIAPEGGNLKIRSFSFSTEGSKVLIYTNTKRVWRLDTRGDYWVTDLKTKSLRQLGKTLPKSSLMFAKFSPDGQHVAYVSEHNLYVENLASGNITALTTNGSRKLINGTFDWAYEEEFACRDGFQWSPDSKHVAYWQIDASEIPDFFLINNTDSVYSKLVPIEYPKAGVTPSAARIGVVNINSKNVVWADLPGDARQHYIPRIEWNSPELVIVQQLNRKQNESKLFKVNTTTGAAQLFYTERDNAWIDVNSPWENTYTLDFRHRIKWLSGGREFLWCSDKDGWRHMYRLDLNGKEKLLTPGNYDVMQLLQVDEKGDVAYLLASPDNATQQYLFKIKLDGTGKLERVTPKQLSGTHDYDISPTGKVAYHTFHNTYTKPIDEFVSLPQHKPLSTTDNIDAKLPMAVEPKVVEFFKVKTSEGVEMDGWMIKPKDFDPSKKYPALFYVYTEPASTTVNDTYGTGRRSNFNGDLSEEGYIYLSLDNRGTPAPKGAAWRKSIYRKIGQLNIKDQALATKEILKWGFVDPDRIAVWGHSGGGAATLNLLFQYPEIYKTGIALAAITNQFTYDNIYQERYMGLPQENPEDYLTASPITYAKNLQGNLLYIHGTGDDNVHYANAEMLVNELVKHNKQFQFMPYPNRTHGIREGEGTRKHLTTLFSNFLRQYCPPGAR